MKIGSRHGKLQIDIVREGSPARSACLRRGHDWRIDGKGRGEAGENIDARCARCQRRMTIWW